MGTNQRASIVMSEAEITDFVNNSRTGTLATIGPDGQPHLTAMWYGVVDGEIWLETKAKAKTATPMTPCVECPSKALPRSSTIPTSRTGSESVCGSATPVPTVTT